MMIHEIDWNQVPLGEKPDREIARSLKVSTSVVYNERRRRNIRRRTIDWDSVPFGTKTDREIALDLDISPRAVFRQRRKRGIAAYGRHGK